MELQYDQLDGKNPDNAIQSLSLCIRAVIALQRNDPKTALVYTQLAQDKSQILEVLVHHGIALLKDHQPEKALSILNQVIATDPFAAQAFWYRQEAHAACVSAFAWTPGSLDRRVALLRGNADGYFSAYQKNDQSIDSGKQIRPGPIVSS